MHFSGTAQNRALCVALVMFAFGGVIYVALKPPTTTVASNSAAKQIVSEERLDRTAHRLAMAPASRSDSRLRTQQAPKLKTQPYEVVAGDTIDSIATRFGLKATTILWANDMEAEDLLHIGQRLTIPTADGLTYKIRNGDTLWDIAEQFQIDIDRLVTANPDVDPSALRADQVILIPGGEPPTRRVAATARGASRSGAPHTFDVWPASGPVTDPFGWRTHPVYGTEHFHDGMDIGVDAGTPLRSVAAGTVTMAARYGAYGLAVRIDHGGGISTQYAHMSQIDVQAGQKVSAGEHIGYSGNTGVTTGPHLHFSVFQNGSPVDPAPWLP